MSNKTTNYIQHVYQGTPDQKKLRISATMTKSTNCTMLLVYTYIYIYIYMICKSYVDSGYCLGKQKRFSFRLLEGIQINVDVTLYNDIKRRALISCHVSAYSFHYVSNNLVKYITMLLVQYIHGVTWIIQKFLLENRCFSDDHFRFGRF